MSEEAVPIRPATTDSPRGPRKGDEIELHMESAAFEGGCVGRHEGMVVFVDGCVPGDRVRARVIHRRRSHIEARTIQVVEKSAARVEPPCEYFGTCGGCRWQDLRYEEQLRWKRLHVVDALERIGGLRGLVVDDTVPCALQYYYRNKMEFSFGTQRWLTDKDRTSAIPPHPDFAVGLHIPGRFDKVLDVERCLLQSDVSNRIVNLTRRFALDNRLPAYSTRTHTGLLRHLVVRTSLASGEVMAILVTADAVPDLMSAYAEMMRREIPDVSTLVQGIHRGKAQVSFTQELRVLYGSGSITERIAGNDFTISPFSFFQTNTTQAEELYRMTLAAAALTGRESVWDLYCGAGTITLAAARNAARALGAEINERSVEDARRSAVRNGVGNATFVAGDLRETIDHAAAHVIPDVVITDPPRAGMHRDVVEGLLTIAPQRIIYVSCNPATLARDLAILAEGYTIDAIHPIDMFPQTYHVEVVATLRRR